MDPTANTFQFLNKSVTTPGTATALTEYLVPDGFVVVLTARRSNTQSMFIAETAAKAQSGARKVLVPGQSITMHIDKTSRIFVDSENSNDVLEVQIEQGT